MRSQTIQRGAECSCCLLFYHTQWTWWISFFPFLALFQCIYASFPETWRTQASLGSRILPSSHTKYVDAIGGHRFSEGTSADRKIQRTLIEVGVYSFFLIHIMILWWGRYISYVRKIQKKKNVTYRPQKLPINKYNSLYTSCNTLPKLGQRHIGLENDTLSKSATHRVRQQHTQRVQSSQCVAH